MAHLLPVLVVAVLDSLIVEVVVVAVVVAVVEAQLVEMLQLLVQPILAVVAAVQRIRNEVIIIQHQEGRALLLLLTQEPRDFQAAVFQHRQDQVIQSTPLHQVEH
jgi:hypothetical protein